MDNKEDVFDIDLICIIVNFGLGSKLVRLGKKHGIPAGTVTLGRGTINSSILDYMGLSDVRKEIVFMVSGRQTGLRALEEMNKEFEFSKPNHGIAFTTSICGVLGTKSVACSNIKKERGAGNTMYHLITIIVDKGKGEGAVDAATKAGSKGGTIMNARGSGVHETSKLFSMEIEPEREIVMILSEQEATEAIVTSIKEELKIEEPGNGIIFIQDVNTTYGIYK